MPIDDRFLEMRDIVERLNARPTSIELCRALYEDYLRTPKVSGRKELKKAYERIPSHMRRYVGDQDVKDIPVRMIIYGTDEIEGWSHYRAAKSANDRLPSISIPSRNEEDYE